MSKREFNKYQQERRVLLKKAGKCITCTKPNNNGKARCNKCLKYHNDKNNIRLSFRKKNGLCVRCGKEALEGKTRCSICRAKDKINRIKNKKEKDYVKSRNNS